MGTLMDKLNATNATKEQIRQAIERKKVSVPTNTPLKDYPAKIDGIYPDALFLKTDLVFKHVMPNPTWPAYMFCEGKVNNKTVIIGVIHNTTTSSYMYASENEPWRLRRFPSGLPSLCVAYGNGRFVIAPSNRSNEYKIMVSSDGVNWEQITPPIYAYYQKILFADGWFYAIAQEWDDDYQPYILKSKDGKKWNNLGKSNWSMCARSNGLKYPIKYFPDYNSDYKFRSTDGNKEWYSRDCVNWYNSSYDYLGVSDAVDLCYKNDFALVITSGGQSIFRNADGSWNKVSIGSGSTGLQLSHGTKYGGNLTYFNGNYIFKKSGMDAYYTKDGLTWKKTSTGMSSWPALYTYAGNLMCITGTDNGQLVRYSRDGVTWVDEITTGIVDCEGNDNSTEVINALLAIETAALQAAYEAGVNSI